MNIFVLDQNPRLAASAHCDKHVVKMLLETAQMICTTAHVTNYLGYIPYKKTHENHPCTKWVRESQSNFQWLYNMFAALHYEWQYRYAHTREHKSWSKVIENIDIAALKSQLPDIGLTPFAQAMPEHYRDADAVKAYRDYYINDKSDLLVYTKTKAPEWLKEALNG